MQFYARQEGMLDHPSIVVADPSVTGHCVVWRPLIVLVKMDGWVCSASFSTPAERVKMFVGVLKPALQTIHGLLLLTGTLQGCYYGSAIRLPVEH
jgi:hypothetical protein